MSRRVILVPEFVVLLEKRLHRTLAMESAWCLGISLLLVFVFRWTPFSEDLGPVWASDAPPYPQRYRAVIEVFLGS